MISRDGHSVFRQVILLEDLNADLVQAFENEVSLNELPKVPPETVMEQRKADLVASVEYLQSRYQLASDGSSRGGGAAVNPRTMLGPLLPGDLVFRISQLILEEDEVGYGLTIVWDDDQNMRTFSESAFQSQGLQLIFYKSMQLGLLAAGAAEGLHYRSGLDYYQRGGRPANAVMVRESEFFSTHYRDFYLVSLMPDAAGQGVFITYFRNDEMVGDFGKESSELLAYWRLIGPTFRDNNFGRSIGSLN